MTKQQAIEQGYTHFIYEKGDSFQRLLSVIQDEIDYNKNPVLVEKESNSPCFDEKTIKDIVANELDGQYYDETKDDYSGVYDLIMEIDFSHVTKVINEKLESVKHYRSSGVKLVEETALDLKEEIELLNQMDSDYYHSNL